MEYTKESLKGWAEYLKGHYKDKGDTLMMYASAWEREVAELKEELAVTEKLLEERQRVLDAIPECETHGGSCSPHALEWVKKMKCVEKDKEELRELCELLNRHANKFDFEGTSSEDEKRVHELWAKHITKHINKGEGR